MTTTASHISQLLIAEGLPKPSTQWLTTILSTQRPSTPSKAVLATCKLRLLASDFTTPNLLDSSTPSFPSGMVNAEIKESKLSGSIPVQVLNVEDMSKSRLEQIEAIEAFERGEMTKGREIIRLAPAQEGDDGMPIIAQPAVSGSSGPHKLVLQDCKGQRVFGFELKAVSPKIGLGMDIGTKMVLKGCIVARGMVLLEPENVMVLGGKIEHLHKIWQKDRKKELRDAIQTIEDE